jgi:hypothetical protein
MTKQLHFRQVRRQARPRASPQDAATEPCRLATREPNTTLDGESHCPVRYFTRFGRAGKQIFRRNSVDDSLLFAAKSTSRANAETIGKIRVGLHGGRSGPRCRFSLLLPAAKVGAGSRWPADRTSLLTTPCTQPGIRHAARFGGRARQGRTVGGASSSSDEMACHR